MGERELEKPSRFTRLFLSPYDLDWLGLTINWPELDLSTPC